MHAEAAEIGALQIDPLLGFGAAQLAQLELRHRARLGPSARDTLCSIGMPWQSHPGTNGERLPSIERERTTKSLRILLSAVPRWTRAVRIGRSVVQNPGRRVLARFHQARVKAEVVPLLEDLGFPLGQIRLHREIGFGKLAGSICNRFLPQDARATRRYSLAPFR